jgi:glycine cleavage system regulatory protein
MFTNLRVATISTQRLCRTSVSITTLNVKLKEVPTAVKALVEVEIHIQLPQNMKTQRLRE